jgi:hypothetical protein
MNRPIGDTPGAAIACGTRAVTEWEVNRDFSLEFELESDLAGDPEIYLEIDRTMEQGVVR